CSLFKLSATTATFTLSLHDALPILALTGPGEVGEVVIETMSDPSSERFESLEGAGSPKAPGEQTVWELLIAGSDLPAKGLWALLDRKSTRLNSSHVKISYAVFCLKK